MAIVASIGHFEVYLYGQQFIVVTDHKPCTSLMTSAHLNKRLRRFVLKLQSYHVCIIYRPGKDNNNADGMSRQNWEDNEEDICDSTLSQSVPVDRDSPEAPISGGGDMGTDTATAMERRRSEEKGRNGERGRSRGDNRH